MEVMCNNYIPGDSRLIEVLVSELKSQGIFDQFRKECISDVDTKPAYQNLKQRVEGSVTTFLKEQTWSVDLNKNQLREQLRKNLYESGFLETGVERIVDQVVNPKINTVFLPKVEEIFYRVLGVDKPVKKEVSITDLLPTDLEAVSPESVHSFKVGLKKDCDTLNDSFPSSTKLDEDESPPFEPLNGNTENNTSFDEKIIVDENTRDSHLSGFSGLESHDSNPGSGDNQCYQMELSNQDSQISSESHLSIVTSEETTKMEVCEDSNNENNVEKSEEVIVFDETENNIKNDNTDIKNDVMKESENKNIEDKKSKSSEKSSKDRKDEKQRKSSSSSKDKDKSSSKSSSQSKNKESRDKDRRDSKSGSSRDKDKPKEKQDKDKEKSDKEKSSKKSDKEKYKSDKEKSDKGKADRSKFDKEAANKMEKEKIEKDRSKDRSDKSKSERERSKSETDKSKPEKDKSNKEKDRNTSDKYKEKSFKTKEKSDKDKEKVSKDKSSRDRSSSSKDTKENKESNKEGKDKAKEESKEKSKSSSSCSKYSSSKDKKPSTPKKESSSQSTYKDKSSSSSSTIDSKSKTVPEKSKQDETIDKYSSNKKDKQKDSKKKSKDDHYSSKLNKTDRRSTDRDSNDGQSSKNYSNSYSESSRSENNSQGYTSSNLTGGSGDSSNSDQVDAANVVENIKVSEEVVITEIPKVKYSKPKFALNFEEARKIMKIRKQLALLEKQNKLSLTKIELPFENCILKKSEDVVNTKENIGISKQDTEIINENKLVPTIEGTDLSKENWEALEAKLAQVMAEVNCNSYESDEDFEFHGYSPVETTPKHSIDSSTDLVKKTEMETINTQKEYQNNKENVDDEENLSSKLIPNNFSTINKNKNGLTELNKRIPNNCQQLSANLRTSINTNEDKCYYLEKPNREEEWNLRYLKELISKLEKEVDFTIQCPTDNSLQKKGKKRKFEDAVVDMKNNNKINYMETVKRSLSASSQAAANKKRMSSTDITPTEVFPLPLSPAESDKSNERKDEDLLIPIKQKRIVRGYSQRYSSDDLYKPRPTFGGRRSKFTRRNV